MLTIIVEDQDFFDEETETFITYPGFVLELEHSLVSMSKWESVLEKPFLSSGNKTDEETLFYIECMIVSTNYPKNVLKRLSASNFLEINNYIEAKRSATTFGITPNKSNTKEVVTSELIYYWMIAFGIPTEYETWHLNRLFALIRICNIKNEKPKKMSRSELAARNRELNEQRKAALGTTG